MDGPILVGDDKEEAFIGNTIGREHRISEELTQKIDLEIDVFFQVDLEVYIVNLVYLELQLEN